MFSSGIELTTLHLYLTNIACPHAHNLPLNHQGLVVLKQLIQYIAQFECTPYTPHCGVCSARLHAIQCHFSYLPA